ncbi:MAG: TonB-dependent receptor [Sphingobium sp.]|nr:TonB-dependent receptor [Sphingobium sp.]
MIRQHHALAGTATLALLLAAPALAQSGAQPADQAGEHDHPDDIIVTAVIPRSHVDLLAGTSVLSGEDLARDLRPNLGETLARQPGVTASSFGPNASRPILRGFSGDRIRLLTDGIGSFDVSATSADHAVAINPLLADRIEVLHGPSALLYGSSAVGGVVNVIDSRIPTRRPKDGIAGDIDATYGSASDERTVAGKVDYAIGGSGFVAHVDGSYSKTGDLDTGGYILSPALRAQAAASSDPDIAGLANLAGKLPNSASESWSYGGSLAWLAPSGGSIGVAVSRLHNFYGVPERFSLDPAIEAEAPRIRMDQTRADLRAKIPVEGSFLDEINLRGGWADYRHDELEADGSVGTTFLAKGLETRLELVQTRRGGWDGVSGAQVVFRKGQILGDEKFQPNNEANSAGLFTMQSLDLGNARIEAGARYEHADISAMADSLLGNPAYDRKYDTFSASLGANYSIAPDWRIGVNISRSERAPTVDELFSRGNHAGTQAFELGNPDFGTERGWGVEALLHGRGRDYHISISAFYNRFSSFIYDHVVPDAACLAANGGEPLDFPCFQFSQAPARYYGAEIEGEVTFGKIGKTEIKADALADYTNATIIGGAGIGGPVPRIPPLRILGGISADAGRLNGRIEIEHDFAQNRVNALETPTAAFTLVNASIGWHPLPDNQKVRLLVSANNIFDVTARRHASILKDYAPLAGRDVRVTLSLGL